MTDQAQPASPYGTCEVCMPDFWFCTRRVARDCTVLVPVKANCPGGYMCSACRTVVHRWDVARNEGRDLSGLARVPRTAWRSKYTPRPKRKKGAPKIPRRRCGFPGGCKNEVDEGLYFLCRYHFQHGEDMQVMW